MVNPLTGQLASTTAIGLLPSGKYIHFGGLVVDPTGGTIYGSGREATVSQKGDIYTLTPGGIASLIGSTGVGEPGDLAFQPIPEPATALLLGFGLAAVAAVRRRRGR